VRLSGLWPIRLFVLFGLTVNEKRLYIDPVSKGLTRPCELFMTAHPGNPAHGLWVPLSRQLLLRRECRAGAFPGAELRTTCKATGDYPTTNRRCPLADGRTPFAG